MKKIFIFVAVIFVLSLFQSAVSHFLGLNELMEKGKFGSYGVVIYDVMMVVSGCILTILIEDKDV